MRCLVLLALSALGSAAPGYPRVHHWLADHGWTGPTEPPTEPPTTEPPTEPPTTEPPLLGAAPGVVEALNAGWWKRYSKVKSANYCSDCETVPSSPKDTDFAVIFTGHDDCTNEMVETCEVGYEELTSKGACTMASYPKCNIIDSGAAGGNPTCQNLYANFGIAQPGCPSRTSAFEPCEFPADGKALPNFLGVGGGSTDWSATGQVWDAIPNVLQHIAKGYYITCYSCNNQCQRDSYVQRGPSQLDLSNVEGITLDLETATDVDKLKQAVQLIKKAKNVKDKPLKVMVTVAHNGGTAGDGVLKTLMGWTGDSLVDVLAPQLYGANGRELILACSGMTGPGPADCWTGFEAYKANGGLISMAVGWTGGPGIAPPSPTDCGTPCDPLKAITLKDANGASLSGGNFDGNPVMSYSYWPADGYGVGGADMAIDDITPYPPLRRAQGPAMASSSATLLDLDALHETDLDALLAALRGAAPAMYFSREELRALLEAARAPRGAGP